MTCPKCGTPKMQVVDTATDDAQIVRRRRCRNKDCWYHLYTVETPVKHWQGFRELERIKRGGE